MASGGQHYNDSSGSTQSKRHKGGLPDLELREIQRYDTRDSGCYTGSPMPSSTVASSSAGFSTTPSTTTPLPSQYFLYDEMTSTPAQDVIHRHQIGRSGIPNLHKPRLMDSGTHHTCDEDDDVFEMSDSSFLLDSGIQTDHPTISPSQATPDDTHWPDDADVDDGSTRRKHSQHTDQTTEVGRSKFYIRHSRLDTGTESDSEREDDDGSSTEEFETAEFEISTSPVSTPIDIPQRSTNSSPGDELDDDEDDVFDEPVPGLPGAGSMGSGSVPTPRAGHNPLQRRLTLGDFKNIAENRPLSGHGRLQGRTVAQEAQSLEGAHGPLPDVIPRQRGRAYSESALSDSHKELGRSLACMCDMFAQVHINRQQTLNLMQARQKSNSGREQQTRSSSSTPPNQSPGFLKSLHQRFFNTPPE